ncbi:MAG: hypothetical protein MI921_27770 [Cytophagales bacterium]|nr:hypothetical protein [Cytophagales bacterium]
MLSWFSLQKEEPRMVRRLLITGLLLIGVSACAAPAKVENMVVQAATVDAPADPSLSGAICVASVTGGEETNPLWTSEVDDADFKAALQGSLANSGLLAADSDNCNYELEANLLGLAQPSFGFSFEVTAHVNYSIFTRGARDPYLLETVTASHTATVGDAFFGIRRLRLANEGAIQNNIKQYIDIVMNHQPS